MQVFKFFTIIVTLVKLFVMNKIKECLKKYISDYEPYDSEMISNIIIGMFRLR